MWTIRSINNHSETREVDDDVQDEGEKVTKENKEIKFFPSRHTDKAWTFAYGIFNGARFAAFYAAVLFMPMADYIVCIATTPIFSYIFSCLIIKTKFTFLKVYYSIYYVRIHRYRIQDIRCLITN